jgi:chromosome segregation ATPase
MLREDEDALMDEFVSGYNIAATEEGAALRVQGTITTNKPRDPKDAYDQLQSKQKRQGLVDILDVWEEHTIQKPFKSGLKTTNREFRVYRMFRLGWVRGSRPSTKWRAVINNKLREELEAYRNGEAHTENVTIQYQAETIQRCERDINDLHTQLERGKLDRINSERAWESKERDWEDVKDALHKQNRRLQTELEIKAQQNAEQRQENAVLADNNRVLGDQLRSKEDELSLRSLEWDKEREQRIKSENDLMGWLQNATLRIEAGQEAHKQLEDVLHKHKQRAEEQALELQREMSRMRLEEQASSQRREESFSAERSSLEGDRASLRSYSSALDLRVKQLQEELGDAAQERSGLLHALDRAREDKLQLEAEVQQLRLSVAGLDTQVAARNNEISMRATELRRAESALTQSLDQLSHLRKVNATVTMDLAAAPTPGQFAAVEQQMDDVKRRTTLALDDARDTLNEQCASIRSTATEAAHFSSEAERELQQLQERVRQLQARLGELRALSNDLAASPNDGSYAAMKLREGLQEIVRVVGGLQALLLHRDSEFDRSRVKLGQLRDAQNASIEQLRNHQAALGAKLISAQRTVGSSSGAQVSSVLAASAAAPSSPRASVRSGSPARLNSTMGRGAAPAPAPAPSSSSSSSSSSSGYGLGRSVEEERRALLLGASLAARSASPVRSVSPARSPARLNMSSLNSTLPTSIASPLRSLSPYRSPMRLSTYDAYSR